MVVISTMTSDRPPTYFRRVATGTAAAGLALVGLAAAPAAASSEPPADGADATAAPSTDEIQFPIAYEVGQSAVQRGTFTTEMGGSALGGRSISLAFSMDMSSTVTEVDDDGGGVMEITFDGVELIDAPAGAELDTIEHLVGLTYIQEFEADGELGDLELVDEDELTPEQLAAADQFGSQVQSAAVVYPEEAVTVGSSWTDETEIEAEGVTVPITFEYELVALDAETYTLEMTAESTFSDRLQGTDVDGEILASGTVVGSRTNALAVSVEMAQDMSMEAEGQGTITLDLGVLLETDGIELPAG